MTMKESTVSSPPPLSPCLFNTQNCLQGLTPRQPRPKLHCDRPRSQEQQLGLLKTVEYTCVLLNIFSSLTRIPRTTSKKGRAHYDFGYEIKIG